MAFNTPSGLINNITFGPAKVYIGTFTEGSSLNTPSQDVGFISEDGVSTCDVNQSPCTDNLIDTTILKCFTDDVCPVT